MSQPLGFIDKDNPTHVCKLKKTIYSLKQAPRAWYQKVKNFLLSSGFKNSYADAFLFVFNVDGHILYLLIYVDDIIITSIDTAVIDCFVTDLANRFSIKDLGLLIYFLGVKVVHNKNALLLSQKRYIQDLLTQV